MVKLRARELRRKSKDELIKQLGDLKQELSTLKVAKVTGGAGSKLAKICIVRKQVALVQTVMNQLQKENVRKLFAKKHYIPRDLRAKKTRALRRELTKKERSIKTAKEEKRNWAFPTRRFAVKA